MQNAFRKTGLYPFFPDALKHNALLQKTKKTPANCDQGADLDVERAKNVLMFAEMYIDGKFSEEFMAAEKTRTWTGDPEHQSLFFFWKEAFIRSCKFYLLLSFF